MFRCWFDAVTLFKPVFVVIVNNQSVSLSVSQSVSQSVHQSASQPVRPSVLSQSICPSVSLSAS